MVHEPPSTCRFRCVGVAFAVIAEWCPANKLPCVIAFVCGLLSANTALHCGAEGGILYVQTAKFICGCSDGFCCGFTTAHQVADFLSKSQRLGHLPVWGGVCHD